MAIQLRTFARSPPTLSERMTKRGIDRGRDEEGTELNSRLFTAIPVEAFYLFFCK